MNIELVQSIEPRTRTPDWRSPGGKLRWLFFFNWKHRETESRSRIFHYSIGTQRSTQIIKENTAKRVP